MTTDEIERPSRTAARRGVLTTSPSIVAFAAWLLPGAGYWLIGQRRRGMILGLTVLLTFVMGTLIGGVRVIDVPGFERDGRQARYTPEGRHVDPFTDDVRDAALYDRSTWALRGHGLFSELVAKPWFFEQALAGGIAFVGSIASVKAALAGIAMAHARPLEIGTLYTAVAGMLNLLTVIDSAHRASQLDIQRSAAS